jgi:alanyl-tRNA synthetase
MSTRRLYYDDAMLRSFEAQVLGCEPVVAEQKPAWGVILDQTAFYPTSGGQPNDAGKLGESRVVDVRDEKGEIIHVVDRPVPRGPASGCLDWARRFDHMQQHTGQHLLSAVLQERFGLPTVSFHLGSLVSTIDVRGREPSAEILEGAERVANGVIFGDRPVTVRYGTADELAEIGVRKQVQREGTLRAIEIEGIDLQPCGGTHVSTTGQIGLLLVQRCSRIRQDWRVEFVCGGRAERSARADRVTLRRVAELLKCSDEDAVKSVERLTIERDSQFKILRATTGRLAEAEARLVLQETAVGENGLKVVARVLEGVEPAYLAQFAAQIAKTECAVALLVRRECGHLAFAQHPSAGNDMSALLKQVLEKVGGKGGGTRDFARGSLENAQHAGAAITLAKSLIERQLRRRA